MTDLETIEIENAQRLPAPTQASIVDLRNFEQVWKFAQMIANTEMVPEFFQKKPQAVVVAIQWGVEIGVPPMQALQNIAVINGRPSIWGDLGKAIVQAHPELAGYSEEYDSDLKVARVTIKRRRANGAEIEITGDFSWQDAVDAKLSSKNTYQAYARDMLMWRAFWRAARATFADALRGLSGAEESRDMERVKPAKVTVVSDEADALTEALGKKKQGDHLTATEVLEHRRGTPAEPPPERGGSRPDTTKDHNHLVKQCEVHFDMLNIPDDARLAAAKELVAVPEKAKTIKGLSVDSLYELEIALAKEVGGSDG